MLCSAIKTRIDLPHEAGQWIEVKMLGFVDLEKARMARLVEVLDKYSGISDSMISTMKADRAASSNGIIEAGDSLDSYDLETLLRLAITRWSYDAKVSDETVRDLDAVTAKFVARQLVPKEDTDEILKALRPASTRSK